MKKGLWAALFCLIPMPLLATNLPMDIAVLRGLDKVTGRISTFSIPVGEVGQFGKTFIVPESCYTRPPEESPENSAFLYIYEKSLKGENVELFKGWMFSSNPALSSMEDPVYDIWVLECIPSPQKEEEKKENIQAEAAMTSVVKDLNASLEESSVIPSNEAPLDAQLLPARAVMEELED